jgi:hypothetical protein
MSKRQDFILGRNVTEQAKAHEGRGSAVLSLRLSGEELDSISNIAEVEDKTLSQIVREAIRQWLSNRQRETRWAAMSFPDGTMMYFGNTAHGTFGTGEPRTRFKQGGGSELGVPVS